MIRLRPSKTTVEESRPSLQRFDDETTIANACHSAVQMIWNQGSAVGAVWSINTATIGILLTLNSEHPRPGVELELSARFDTQEIHVQTKVKSTTEIYGSFRLISCGLHVATKLEDGDLQRRANTRFTFSPLYPLYCFAKHPTSPRNIALRAIDVSNGGISLKGDLRGAPFVPGTPIPCSFDAPSIGTFTATLIFHHADLELDPYPASARISAAFADFDTKARNIVGSCLTRPLSSNSLHDLQREHLLPSRWVSIVEFSAARLFQEPEKQYGVPCREIKLIGRLGDDEVCSFTQGVQSKATYSIDRTVANSKADERRLLRRMFEEIETRARSFDLDKTQIEFALRSEYSFDSQSESVAAEESYDLRFAQARILGPRRAWNQWRRSRGGIVSTRTSATHKVRWDEYAQAYDVMCSANPAYQKNLALFREWIADLCLPPASTICDVGAGTGNYVVELARRFPDARVTHLDSDPMMNRMASRKYRLSGIGNVGFASSNATTAHFAPSTLDLIVCVNALYTFAEPSRVLSAFHSWLKPAGYLFVIDLGRPMDVADWSRYIVTSSVTTIGVSATVKAFFKGRKAIGQNRLIRREQELGRYWLHSPTDFNEALIDAGFEIARTQICYRDVCDLAICRKPIQPHSSTRRFCESDTWTGVP